MRSVTYKRNQQEGSKGVKEGDGRVIFLAVNKTANM